MRGAAFPRCPSCRRVRSKKFYGSCKRGRENGVHIPVYRYEPPLYFCTSRLLLNKFDETSRSQFLGDDETFPVLGLLNCKLRIRTLLNNLLRDLPDRLPRR